MREYWIAEPTAQYLEVWQRVDDTFQRLGIFDSTNRFRSMLFDADIAVSAIFPSTSKTQ